MASVFSVSTTALPGAKSDELRARLSQLAGNLPRQYATAFRGEQGFFPPVCWYPRDYVRSNVAINYISILWKIMRETIRVMGGHGGGNGGGGNGGGGNTVILWYVQQFRSH